MSRFFIYRPIFAWVVAIFIVLFGLVAISRLPVSQYPTVAPPTIRILATYPGATAQTLDETVLSVIEREMNGADGLMYMESSSESTGMGTLTLTFTPERDEDLAQVDVQNRLSRAEPKLPAEVKQLGVKVYKAMSNFLLVLSFISEDPALTSEDVADYVARNVLPEVQRTEGVGNAQFFAAERSLRIWLDPSKMQGLNISIADVVNAIRAQNAQIVGGSVGSLPSPDGQRTTAMVVVPGQLTEVEEFENIILRANPSGSTVRMKDVARVQLGIETYNYRATTDGKPTVAIAVQLNSAGNALATSEAIQNKMHDLERYFPSGMTWSIPFNTATFVSLSIHQVVKTLFEALALVILIMFLFLQNFRYTFVPTIVVPISLLGAFAIMSILGMSINILAMFAMVLVIGIVVDDAIIVVENVERIMETEHLPPRQATLKAMTQIGGAIIGITVILITVFIPLAMFTGATGNIYRQFSLVMVASIGFSAFFALTLTPALCASLLKPITPEIKEKKETRKDPLSVFFRWFNRNFQRLVRVYNGSVRRVLRLTPLMILLYIGIIGGIAFLFREVPSSFLPVEDQGNVLVNIQLPQDASRERTHAVAQQVQDYMLAQPEVENITIVYGFSFLGQGQNTALAFATLKDWSLRTGAGQDAISFANRATRDLRQIRDAFIFVMSPPAIPELGVSSGFVFRLQDRAGHGHAALVNARNQLLGLAAQSPILANVRPDGMEDSLQLKLNIDRDVANAQGITMAAINQTLSTTLGSSYINDFPNRGRMQRVTVQGDFNARSTIGDLLAITVPNNQGEPVPLATFASTEWIEGPTQVTRYNGYISMKINGEAAPGFSSGDAMKEMERLMNKLPSGFGYEWTGQSLDEIKAGNNSVKLYAFSVLAVFLCLAALYESWSIPFAVMLVVPLGVLGVISGVFLRGMPNDIYFQIALITVIGLSAKNAILIVEFAKDLQAAGMSPLKAALEAAHLRFRPILMTSLAFILGVVPLFFASGASSASQREIGTGVLGGMLTGTFLAIFFVPTFYLVVRKIFPAKEHPEKQEVPALQAPSKESVS